VSVTAAENVLAATDTESMLTAVSETTAAKSTNEAVESVPVAVSDVADTNTVVADTVSDTVAVFATCPLNPDEATNVLSETAAPSATKAAYANSGKAANGASQME